MQFLLRSFLSLLFFLLSVNTASAEQTYAFDLPTQPLTTTLINLADISGTKLMYADSAVKNLQSTSLKGTYTVAQALDQILDKNRLSYELVDNSMIVIKQKAPDPTQLPEVKVTGYVDENAPGNPSYTRTQSSTASKSNLPIMKTPASVQVIPRAAIEDQQAIQVEDAIRNVSGVFPGFTFGGFAEEFMIRGFNTAFATYRDGFRTQAARLSLANIERVEVVKGAASNLYGRIEPGGMINLITKRPQARSYYALNQQFGSFGQYQTQLDATGAINESGTLLYRINYEYLKKDLDISIVGLKYFNVYGNREFFKNSTASMVVQFGHQIMKGLTPKLFEGSDKILRDFIYIEDIIQANIKAAEPKNSGVYNVGTGKARSFEDIVDILQSELNIDKGKEYIKNPFIGSYQFFTQANIDPNFRLMRVTAGGDLSLTNVTLSNGCAEANSNVYPFGGGGAVYNSGTLSLFDVMIKDNESAGSGGGVFNAGIISGLENSRFENNIVNIQGGAIFVDRDDSLGMITNSQFISNSAGVNSSGGAIFLTTNASLAGVSDSYFKGNTANQGGGINGSSSSAKRGFYA